MMETCLKPIVLAASPAAGNLLCFWFRAEGLGAQRQVAALLHMNFSP